MKRILLFMPVVASLLIAGCSQDEVTPNDVENGKKKTYYMAVNLVSSDATGTRAADGYEDGTNVENAVRKVRFYFFNGVGGAVNVKPLNGAYVNYYDWTPKEGDQTSDLNNGDDIENDLKATIVINTEDGDKVPQRIAALVNPRVELIEAKSLSMSELRGIVAHYADAQYTSSGTFVMFNSVYSNNGIEIGSAPIEKKNLSEDIKDAELNPVSLHVERCVAKVRVTLDQAIGFDSNNRLALKDKDGEPIKVEGQQVYLTLNGWDLTAETSEGRLVKKINPAWEGIWWNSAYRSFWAINSMAATNMYDKYSSIGTSFGNDNVLYTNENAQARDIDGTDGLAQENTKVIIKGTLCKEDGSPLTIASHLGVYLADDANLTKLKESFLTQLSVNGRRYYYETGTGREQIGAGDLQIVIANQVEAENSQNNCYVYPQLTSDATQKTWYSSLNQDAQPITDAATVINGDLANTDYVHKGLVWKSGMTYYFFEILHPTGPNKTEPGVVRNHIYATNVTKIAGLGTPVYDPEQKIYPEIPNPVNHYVAAEIDILSWRIVNNNYQLTW